MTKEVTEYDALLTMNTIVEDYLLKGVNNATKIAKELKIPRREVLDHIDAWKKIAQNDEGVKARARELLTEMDRSYDQIIRELWVTHSESGGGKDAAAILKLIAEVISKRQETLQKAGLYDDAAIGDELALAEEQMQGIRDLLKKVATEYPETRQTIMEGLGRIFKQPTSLPVQEVASPSA